MGWYGVQCQLECLQSYLHKRIYGLFSCPLIITELTAGHWTCTWCTISSRKQREGIHRGVFLSNIHNKLYYWKKYQLLSRLARRCSSMWEKSVTPVDLLTMKACTKMVGPLSLHFWKVSLRFKLFHEIFQVIGERSYFPDQRVKILPKVVIWFY